MENEASPKDEFSKDGRVWFRNAISNKDLLSFDSTSKLQSKSGQRLSISDTLALALADHGSLMSTIRRLDPLARPVRVVAFNKEDGTNWGVPWHQDRVIAVADRSDVQGFENWTMKSGTWHCEPPQELLNQMMFVRVHLDDTDRANGAMEIAVGSHTSGKVPAAEAVTIAHQHPIESCDAERGDVLVLKMLTLHSSNPSRSPSGRRVLRIDFASRDLPPPLRWA